MKSRRPPIQVPSETLPFALRQSAERFPDKVAIVEPESGEREWTYAQLERLSSILAGALAAHGIAPGDRVALWTKNSVEYVLSFYGILKAGAVIVPVSTHYGERELTHQLRLTGAKGLIASEDRLAQIGKVGGDLLLRVVISDHPNAADARRFVTFS